MNTQLLSNKELVFNYDGKLVTTSKLVAQKFNKKHFNVIRDIRQLECSDDFRKLNFELLLNYRQLANGGSKSEPEYLITKDGFTFLVMGFTGKQAAVFKEEYINAFNRMEKALVGAPSEDEIIQMAMVALSKRLEVKSKELDEAKEVIKTQEPKVKYVDEVLSSEDLIPVTIIAKELGMSAITLNNKLSNMGVQYRLKNTWVLTSRYQHLGYTKTKTHIFVDQLNRTHTNIQTYWTQKGREFIHSILK